jgi:p-cumate 2,3-dioxygenase subunit beta
MNERLLPRGLAVPAELPDPDLSRRLELWLYDDAELLDSWRLAEWYARFTPDCEYLVPATDRPEGDPDLDLFFVRDDWFLLGQRVDAMLNGSAWAESPRSVTRHIVSNVRAWPRPDGTIELAANFVVYRSVLAQLDVYPGTYRMTLVEGGVSGFEIKSRRSTLSLAQLRPAGRVSVIL